MSLEANSIVDITPIAANEVRRLILEAECDGPGLRLGVKGGGCSGLSYLLEFTSERDGDTVISLDGFSLFLDRKSTIYLSGVQLDFDGGLTGHGFVFKNPMASNTCGCGQSFSI
jgi:iron-sulfur cluster assembly protein